MPFRIAAVSFLNTIPLIEKFLSSPAGGVEVVTDLPSRLAPRLERGEVDAALLPVAEILRGRGDGILGTAGIVCRGAVDSVKLFSGGPPASLERVLVDRGSRTSVLLLRILLAEIHGVRPEFIEIEPDPRRLPETGEGILVIGDKCFEFEREWIDRRPDAPALDLGAAWWNLTALPFVFAAWSPAPGSVDRLGPDGVAELAALLDEARDYGLEHRSEIARREAAVGRRGVGGLKTRDAVATYLERSLSYVIGQEEREGIMSFRSRCRTGSELEDCGRLVFHQG